jgi:hypothetical protein
VWPLNSYAVRRQEKRWLTPSRPLRKRSGGVYRRKQSELLHNVWCATCCSQTTITDFTGRVDRGDLLLEGKYARCEAPVARLIESP